MKIFVIAIIAFRARVFDEPMDGVVCGTAVGLGFATHENLRYLTNASDWETLALVRGILTVPSPVPTSQAPALAVHSARIGVNIGFALGYSCLHGSFWSSCIRCSTFRC